MIKVPIKAKNTHKVLHFYTPKCCPPSHTPIHHQRKGNPLFPSLSLSLSHAKPPVPPYKSVTEAIFKKLCNEEHFWRLRKRRHQILCQRRKCVCVITDPSECSSLEKRSNLRNSSFLWRTNRLIQTTVRAAEDEATGSCQKCF